MTESFSSSEAIVLYFYSLSIFTADPSNG